MKMTTNNIPQGYKDSPLGIIPEEWKVKKLGDVSECFSGGTPKASNNEYYDGNIPFIRSGEIHQKNTALFLSELGLTESSAKIVEKGDLLIALYGANSGDSAISQINGAINQAILCIRPHNLLTSFLCPFLELNKNMYIAKYLQGGQGNLSGDIIKNYIIPIPPLPEQQKIAEVLSTWDKAIEKQSQLIEKFELRKKGLMQQLLTGKKRLPGFSSKWKTIKLGDISKRIVRRNINEQCTNVVTISAQKGFIRQTDFFNKKVASETIENYYLVKRNEFCYNKSYSNGFPMGAIKRLKEFDQAVVTTLYICFAVQEESISVDFIEQYFSLGLLNRGLMKIANEGGRAHGLLNVTPNDFFNINLNLPPIDEQKAISSILFNAYNEVVLAKNKIKSLQQQKKGLMQVLLTGKKRIIQ